MAILNKYVGIYDEKIISLLILTILFLVNSLVAFSHETNAHLQRYLRNFADVFSWTETLLLDILPGAILFMITTVIVIRLLVLLCTLIFKGILFFPVKRHGKEVELDEDRYNLIES